MGLPGLCEKAMTLTTGTKLVIFGFAMGVIAGAMLVRIVDAIWDLKK